MMRPGFEQVSFNRACEVIVIPDGTPITVPEGVTGFISQVLGGHYTLQLENGYLVRLEGRLGDVIDREVFEAPKAQHDADGNVVVEEAQVWAQLKTCYDPEIPVDIVELGLIYKCELETIAQAHGEGTVVYIDMTLTAPGCGMGQVLQDDVKYKVENIPGVSDVHVNLTFDPPWSPEKMSEAARLEMGFM